MPSGFSTVKLLTTVVDGPFWRVYCCGPNMVSSFARAKAGSVINKNVIKERRNRVGLNIISPPRVSYVCRNMYYCKGRIILKL